MITDQQVRILMKQLRSGKTVAVAAARAGMDEKTAAKYRKLGKPPSACIVEHTWRTREDPFAEVWGELEGLLEVSPELQAGTLLEELHRKYPGVFQDGQLRTLQRKLKTWRALKGPGKEVFFAQRHQPGDLCESDFCHLNSLYITIAGQTFPHMLYHFVLTYSNWESATICFSENAESLSEGLQNALWQLGGVPGRHRTDSLSAAVKHPGQKDVKGVKGARQREGFTRFYEALLGHYGLKAEHIQPARPNENGDIEQRHYRIRQRLEQALLLRGSREFDSRKEYESFLQAQITRVNQGRLDRVQQELKLLKPLPTQRQEACQRLVVRVSSGSTIRAKHVTYSVPGRLIGEEVEVRVYAERLEVWYAQHRVEQMPRVRGGYHHSEHSINYRHIIDWLIRKPGAFEQYRYQDSLFPSSHFRMAYDELRERREGKAAVKEYLQILALAARESEQEVEDALRRLLHTRRAEQHPITDSSTTDSITADAVKELLNSAKKLPSPAEIMVDEVDLAEYDRLLNSPLTEQPWTEGSFVANPSIANPSIANPSIANPSIANPSADVVVSHA